MCFVSGDIASAFWSASAATTAAEIATVAAAESSVLVGQIPIEGETLSETVQTYEITEENIDKIMTLKDSILSTWLTVPQFGAFYDICIPRQVIAKDFLYKALKFFPEQLILVENEVFYLDSFEIQHIGEPVIYSVINLLADVGVDFKLFHSKRKVTINSLGEKHIETLEKFCEITKFDLEEGFAALNEMPCEIPLSLTVEDAAIVVRTFKDLGCNIRVDKCGSLVETTWDIYLNDAGLNEFAIIKELKELGYGLTDAIGTIKNLQHSGTKIVHEYVYEKAICTLKKIKSQGGSAFIAPSGSSCQSFSALNEEFDKIFNNLTHLHEGSIFKLGKYPQSSSDPNEKQDIEWVFLGIDEIDDGVDGYYFVSKYGLFPMALGDEDWNRKYLNEEFAKGSFTPVERSVFHNGICMPNEIALSQFFDSSSDYICETTNFAKSLGAYSNNGNCAWWYHCFDKGAVNVFGQFYNGNNDPKICIRPSFIIAMPSPCKRDISSQQQQEQQ